MLRSLAWVFVFSAQPLFADKPLSEAAAAFAGKLPAGGIVTGESIAGDRRFSEAGDLAPDGVTPDERVFEIGSISKVFTGLLLAEAVVEKKVKLGTTLEDLLGEDFKFADPRVGEITLLQLSTHTSGLPRLPDNLGPNPDAAEDPYADYDRRKLYALLKTAKIVGEPPFPASYSNLGVGLLGDLLAGAYGKSWEELVQEKIVGPLGMRDTVVTPDAALERRLAPPFRGGEEGHAWHFQALAGAGALHSTAADLLIFGEALLEPEKTPLGESIRLMLEPRAPYNDFGAEMGLGLILGKLDGDRVYEHSGGTGGYRSMLQVIPARKSVRVVLINNDGFPAEMITAATREAAASGKAVISLAPEQLDEFVGVFETSPQARFTVLRVGDRLQVRLTAQPFIPVEPIGDDRFRYLGVAAELQFHRQDGKVTSLTLHQNGREVPAKRGGRRVPTILFPEPDELEAYVGEYQLGPGAVITISLKAGMLFAQLTGQPAVPVFQTRPDCFEYDVVEAVLEFERSNDGDVTGLVLDQNGRYPAKRR